MIDEDLNRAINDAGDRLDVGILLVDRIVDRGARKRRRAQGLRAAGLVLGSAALFGGVIAGVGSIGDETMDQTATNSREGNSVVTSESVRRLVAGKSGAALVVPEDLPPEYEWSGQVFAETDGDTVLSRTSAFKASPVDSAPLIQICTEARGYDGCSVEPGDVERKFGESGVIIRITATLDGPDGERQVAEASEYWRNATLADATTVGWLP